MPLRVRYYVTPQPPPEELVTSVRAVVLSPDGVLVLRNPDAVHALPGGRREPGETFEETLHREVLEETGCEVVGAMPLGVIHLRHLASAPPGYSFLHPDFLQAVYVAEAASAARRAVDDPYELEAGFEPVSSALARVDLGSRIFVRAAVDIKSHLRPEGGTDT